MMERTLRLDVDQLWHVLEQVDPVELMTDVLVRRAGGHTTERPNCRLVPTPTRNGGDWVHVEDLDNGVGCMVPRSVLRELTAAALAGVAAQLLLTPGVVTAVVLGSGTAALFALAVVARHVPGTSFVAIWPGADQDPVQPDQHVLDLLNDAGIGVLVTADADEAVFGATLAVATVPWPDHLPATHMARGAVLVNTSERGLPDSLLHDVDGVYVDELRHLAAGAERPFVRTHLDAGRVRESALSEGWHRPSWRDQRRLCGDLAQVLTGVRPGRTYADDLLMVELLGLSEPEIELACLIERAAVAHRLVD